MTSEPQAKFDKSASSCLPPPNTLFAERTMLRFLMTILIILAAWLLIVLVGTTPCATMRLLDGFYWSNISRGL